ncbi:hypothetical protein OsI_06973 [Oryza sativa Indica Group]|uniref:Uncharacterized protein n=1 Tax=Oryza sativa subsp. indica TaxID=39946 RepID=A2X439_ORYSI|nr:hypothetical protein OsI_06973 [Oryza sativa Indica Group]
MEGVPEGTVEGSMVGRTEVPAKGSVAHKLAAASAIEAMDVLDSLVVRFRIKGEFVTEVREKKYVGGVEALSYIDRDKVSLGEILAHLREYYKHYKEEKKKVKKGYLESLDDVFFEEQRYKPTMQASEDDGNETPYGGGEDEHSVEELGSDGEVRIRQDKHPRYKKKDWVHTFEHAMKFNCKKQFKKAITKYALAEKNVMILQKMIRKR